MESNGDKYKRLIDLLLYCETRVRGGAGLLPWVFKSQRTCILLKNFGQGKLQFNVKYTRNEMHFFSIHPENLNTMYLTANYTGGKPTNSYLELVLSGSFPGGVASRNYVYLLKISLLKSSLSFQTWRIMEKKWMLLCWGDNRRQVACFHIFTSVVNVCSGSSEVVHVNLFLHTCTGLEVR